MSSRSTKTDQQSATGVEAVPRMSLDTLITAIEMDMGATRQAQAQADPGRARPTSTGAAKTPTSHVRDECTSSCSGSSYSCSESCSTSSESEDEPAKPATSTNQVSEIGPQEIDPNTGKFVCHHCNRTFLWADAFRTHVSTHTSDKPHVCTICDKCFTDAGSLAKHMDDHKSNESRAFRTRVPSQRAKEQLAQAVDDSDTDVEEVDSGDDWTKPPTRAKRKRKPTPKVENESEQHDGQYACKSFPRKFNTKRALVKHVRKHEEEKPFQCSKCESRFQTQHRLTQHEATHTNIRSFVCDICNDCFKTLNQLKSHRVCHSDERPFKCVICEMTFPRKHTLTKHMRAHTGERRYECDQCGKKFAYSDRLREHLVSHDPELQNTHSCETCGRKFSHKRNLKVHQRIHIGVRKYKCEFCPKTFLQASGRSRHLKTHTGDKRHLCETCGLRFSYPSEVAEHVRKTHNGEKRHKCETCDKSFHSARDLARHIRIHTGEKPFVCDLCNKSFTQAYTLRIHYRIHTGEKPPKKKKGGNDPPQEETRPRPVLPTIPVEPPPPPPAPEYAQQQVKLPEVDYMKPLLYQSMPYASDQYEYTTDHHYQDGKGYCRNYVELYEGSSTQNAGQQQYVDSTQPSYETLTDGHYEEGTKLPPVSELSRMPMQDVPRYEPLPHAPYKPHIHADLTPVPVSEYQTARRDYEVADTRNFMGENDFDQEYGNRAYVTSRAQEFDTEAYERQTPYENTGDHIYQQGESAHFATGDTTGTIKKDSNVFEADEDVRYKCEGCGQTFVTSSDLLDHLKAHIDAELAGLGQTKTL